MLQTPSRKRRFILAAAAVATVAVTSAAAVTMANAATTPTPSRPYIVAPPGSTLDSGETKVLQLGGRTFSGTAVPANANAATVSVTTLNPSSAGSLTVFTTGTRRPGGATISFRRNQSVTGTATVNLDNRGRLSVYSSARTRFTMRLLSYNTPPAVPACIETISTIAPSVKTLDNVGGSIRTRATDFGSVTLAAGTYDARVIGGFTGFNNTDAAWIQANTLPITGTMTVVKGDTINSTFTNNVTAGGVIIPKSNSDTLTQDPTLSISTFLILTESTDVHIKMFAYAADSSTTGSGHVKANVQSAQFRKLC